MLTQWISSCRVEKIVNRAAGYMGRQVQSVKLAMCPGGAEEEHVGL